MIEINELGYKYMKVIDNGAGDINNRLLFSNEEDVYGKLQDNNYLIYLLKTIYSRNDVLLWFGEYVRTDYQEFILFSDLSSFEINVYLPEPIKNLNKINDYFIFNHYIDDISKRDDMFKDTSYHINYPYNDSYFSEFLINKTAFTNKILLNHLIVEGKDGDAINNLYISFENDHYLLKNIWFKGNKRNELKQFIIDNLSEEDLTYLYISDLSINKLL